MKRRETKLLNLKREESDYKQEKKIFKEQKGIKLGGRVRDGSVGRS